MSWKLAVLLSGGFVEALLESISPSCAFTIWAKFNSSASVSIGFKINEMDNSVSISLSYGVECVITALLGDSADIIESVEMFNSVNPTDKIASGVLQVEFVWNVILGMDLHRLFACKLLSSLLSTAIGWFNDLYLFCSCKLAKLRSSDRVSPFSRRSSKICIIISVVDWLLTSNEFFKIFDIILF